jgi:hypothetical protein
VPEAWRLATQLLGKRMDPSGGTRAAERPVLSEARRTCWTTSQRLLLAAILGLCLFARSGAVLVVLHANPDTAVEGDTRSYVRPALALLEDQRFSIGPGDPRPEFVRTPGYPSFIAAVYGVFGEDRAPVLLAQVALSVVTVFLVALLGARMWSPAVGLLAALLLSLDPLQLYTAGTLLTESLATLLLVLVAGVGFLVFTRDKPKIGMVVLLGLTMALATMVRPVTYYLPLLVVLLFVYRFVHKQTPRAYVVRMLVAFLVPLVVIIGGWQLRNHEEVGSWRFSAVEAKNVYLYRAAGVVGDQEGISFQSAQDQLRTRLALLEGHGQGAYYGRMYKDGLHIILSDPVEATENVASGLLAELTSVRHKTFNYLGLASAPGLVDDAAVALLFGFYCAAVYGTVITARARRQLLAHAFVIGVAGYVLLVSAGPEAIGGRGERFRAVVMPILVLYAARGLAQLGSRVGSRPRRSPVAPGGRPRARRMDP